MSASPPIVEIQNLQKHYGSAQPLRIRHFRINAGERLALFGLEPAAAEMLTHLICGAVLPDEGELRVGGVATHAIATDTEWLGSLDRFGLVSHRAVLVDGLSILANLALPLTVSVEPLAAAVRDKVIAIADTVGLDRARLQAPAATLVPAERLRVHLARALVSQPELVLLEHPTAGLPDTEARTAFGRVLRSAAGFCGAGWMAITDDSVFANAAGSRGCRLRLETGEVRPERTWRLWR